MTASTTVSEPQLESVVLAPVPAPVLAPVPAPIPTATQQEADTDASLPRKRVKKTATIKKLLEFSFKAEARVGKLAKLKMCSIVPIHNVDEKPVYIQLCGGGDIPQAFGIEESSDNANKMTLTYSIGNVEEHRAFDTVAEDLSDIAITLWDTWSSSTKKMSSDTIKDYMNPLVSERKPKNQGTDTWPGVSKASFELADIIAGGKCRIVDKDTGALKFANQSLEELRDSIQDLRGMTWHRIVVELKHVYIQGTKKYGITRKLRFAEVSENDRYEELVPL